MRSRPRDLRASDADRERVVTVLSEAVADGRLTTEEHGDRVQRAYQARTLGDLAGLTEDLAPPSGQPLRLDGSRPVAAFFGSQRREGRWVVPERLIVTAVGGQVVLDLRQALLQSLRTTLSATLVGGQLHLLVPDGVRVLITPVRHPGRMIGGPGQAIGPGGQAAGPRWQAAGPAGRQAAPDGGPAAGELPVIEVRAFTMAGRVRVHTPRRPGRWFGLRSRRG